MKSKMYAAMAGIIVFLFTACSETVEQLDDRITTIYENMSNEAILNPNILDDNLIRVERIGRDHSITGDIGREIRRTGLKSAESNPDELKRFLFNYTNCRIYSLETDECSRIIIYEHEGLYLIAHANMHLLEEGIRLFELRTTDGALCYSMELSDDYRVGEIVIENNEMLNNFRKAVIYQTNINGIHKGAKATYCRQEENWSACFECTMEYCASKWYCSAAVAAFPLEMLASVAASCVGAGPGAAA